MYRLIEKQSPVCALALKWGNICRDFNWMRFNLLYSAFILGSLAKDECFVDTETIRCNRIKGN